MKTHFSTAVKRNPVAILLLVIAFVAMVLITQDSNQRASMLVQRLGAIAENRLALYDLLKGILDAESGQRGYLLTGREEYLEPYTAGVESVNAAFKRLDAIYSREPSSAKLLKKLHQLTDTKLSELAITIQMQQGGKRQTGRDFMQTGIGQEYMNDIRSTGNELLDQENAHLQDSQNEVSDILLFSRIGVALLSATSLLLLLLNMRSNLAFREQQGMHQEFMQLEQQRLQSEVEKSTAQLVELNNHLQTAREDERHNIARNLHDELGALLTTAKLDVARVKSRLGGDSPEAMERLNHLVDTLNAGIALKRRIIEDLWPSTLSNLGLVATLEILGQEFSKSAGIQVHCELQQVQLKGSAELVAYRLVQEATTNIAKYAQAHNVWLTLTTQNGVVEISVRDDGTGFNTHTHSEGSHGLLGMRYRVESEAGTLDLVSNPGHGTLVRARLPINRPAEV